MKNIIKYLSGDRRISTAPAIYINYLRDYSFVITGRYHTVSMCLKNNIPFIAIDSNTPKIRYLLQDALGETERNIQISELNEMISFKGKEFSQNELASINCFVSKAEKMIDSMIFNIVTDIKNEQFEKYIY